MSAGVHDAGRDQDVEDPGDAGDAGAPRRSAGLVVGVDIGNSTTEASAARVTGRGGAEHRGASLSRTSGVKGTVDNVAGVVTAVEAALRRAGHEVADVGTVLLNEATPVISGLAMETITETIITESTMIGHDPRTPGGAGLGVGVTTALADLGESEPGSSVVVVVPATSDFEDTAATLEAAGQRGVHVAAAVLGNDDAVLVVNRLSSPVPVVDEVSRIEAVPIGMLAAVEVAAPGRTVRTLSNAYGLAGVFGLDADQTRTVAPVARALTGNRSAVVVRTPAGDVSDRVVAAGELRLVGAERTLSVDVSRGADEVMDALARVAPLVDATGQAGTNVGGMMASVRQTMADLAGLELDEVRVGDLLAVDTVVPQEVSGGLAGEIVLENAVALAAMVRTRHSGMQRVAEAVRVALEHRGASGVQVQVGGVEAEMAVRGALTTPGTDTPLVVLDLGGGSTDAAVLERGGEVRATHVAGAGDLVTRLIDAELGLGDLEVAEQVKRNPLGKVESFFHLRLEDGTAQFFREPLPATVFARVVTLGEHGLAPVPTRHPLERVRAVRRAAKERVFVVNALRTLARVAPRGDLRSIGFVVLLGGSALDFEIPELVADALAPHGIVCGTGDVRGSEGPRNAVATGLVAAFLERDGTGRA